MMFHYLARGIVIIDGKVLLARQVGADYTFLPGGHIEFGESAEMALLREIAEEIGQKAVIKGFVGAVEWLWSENDQTNHEINLIFEVAMDGLDTSKPLPSKEPHLEFFWSELAELKAHNLLPPPLIDCMTSLERGDRGYWCTFKE